MKKIIDICLSEDDDEDQVRQVRHLLEIWSVKVTRRQIQLLYLGIFNLW